MDIFAQKILFRTMPYLYSGYFVILMLFSANTRINASGIVAFNAYIKTEMTLHPHTPINVVYDGVYYNYGNAYNRHSGFFTAPSDGLYIFTWRTYVAGNKVFNTRIQLNGEQKGVSNCDNRHNPGHGNCSNTVPLVLKTGDSVNIRTTTANFIYPVWSSFKGWRVKKTS